MQNKVWQKTSWRELIYRSLKRDIYECSYFPISFSWCIKFQPYFHIITRVSHYAEKEILMQLLTWFLITMFWKTNENIEHVFCNPHCILHMILFHTFVWNLFSSTFTTLLINRQQCYQHGSCTRKNIRKCTSILSIARGRKDILHLLLLSKDIRK